MRVVVVGAGLGGLSAACHLVGAGHEVVVLERGERPGGRAGLWDAGGFRFDTGPVVLTMARVLDEAFRAAGTALRDRLQLVTLDPVYRACFAEGDDPFGGGVIEVRPGRAAMADEIAATCGSSQARAFLRFCDWLQRLFETEWPAFIDRNFDGPRDLLRSPLPLARLVRLGALRRLDAVVREHFSDRRLVRLFSFQALYAGLSPLEALAVFGIITFMDTIEGVWFPRGGVHAVAVALAEAAADRGAIVRFGCDVSRIRRRPGGSGRVTGVELAGGETVEADAVVANVDPAAVYRLLLDGLEPPGVLRRGEYSPSALVWLAGVAGGAPAGAAHHNIHFGNDWDEAFEDLLVRSRPMVDPSVLVSLPTLTDPLLAPPGSTILYALEPVPNLDGRVDWESEEERLAERLRRRVGRLGYLGGDGRAEVLVQRHSGPLEWRRLGMERGTPFSLAHRFFQSGPFRVPNVDARVPGLVLAGSGTVPGVGVPMVLVSGKLAARRVDEMAAGEAHGRVGWRR